MGTRSVCFGLFAGCAALALGACAGKGGAGAVAADGGDDAPGPPLVADAPPVDRSVRDDPRPPADDVATSRSEAGDPDRISQDVLGAGQDVSTAGDVRVDPRVSFFVSSVGSGTKDGNLGGLAGADALCKRLAQDAGLPDKGWVAYLSTDSPRVDARSRIGNGPWHNVKGQLIATDLAALHPTGAATNPAEYITKRPPTEVMLDEKGLPVLNDVRPRPGGGWDFRGSEHDILTGSGQDGTLEPNRTCSNWTSSAGTAMVGHSDVPPMNQRISPASVAWNGAHSTGCSAAAMDTNGGAGRIYCFATRP